MIKPHSLLIITVAMNELKSNLRITGNNLNKRTFPVLGSPSVSNYIQANHNCRQSMAVQLL